MHPPSRRSFLRDSAAGLAALGLGAGRAVAANDRIGVACIGVRGQGGALLNTFAAQKDVALTHVVDVDESVRAKRAAEVEQRTGQRPKLLVDYRELLDDKSVDVFVVGT